MTFHKPALSVADQIKLLAQRGMKISDPHQAQHYLTHINYYRLRAYWLPYEIIDPNGDHQFRTGTRFADVIAIYQFDRALRLLLLDAIERIEISLRSRWANYLSINRNEDAHGRLYNTLATLAYFLREISPESSWRNKLIELLDSCPQASVSVMGFVDNWKVLPLWEETP